MIAILHGFDRPCGDREEACASLRNQYQLKLTYYGK